MNRRKTTISKSTPLPSDYLTMLEEIFTTHFDTAMKEIQKICPKSSFQAGGAVFADEVLLTLSLVHPQQLSATTLYASCDFDPKVSEPNLENLLSASVDALSLLAAQLLDTESPEKNLKIIQALIHEPLSALENIPFEWEKMESNKQQVFVKVDKSNPKLENITEDWLKKNDPEYEARASAEAQATEELFVTGVKKKS